MLERIGRKIRGSIGWVIMIGIIIAAVYFLFFTASENPPAEVVELTLRALSGGINEYVPTIEANLTRTPQIVSLTEAAPTISLEGRTETRQFAASAWSDNESSARGQNALQVVGPLNTESCEDSVNAYLPGDEKLTAELRVFFAQLVTPSGVIISENFNPGGIVRVEAIDVFGQRHLIYEASPLSQSTCPFSTVILIRDADYQTNTLIISLEKLPAGSWTEIDSVELIGISHN